MSDKSDALEGMVFVITGKVDDNLKSDIKKHGGKVAATVTKAVTHCIYGETEKVYGKLSGKGSTKYNQCTKKKLPCVQPSFVYNVIEKGVEEAEKLQKKNDKEEKKETKKRKAEVKAQKAKKKAKRDPKKVKEEKAKWEELEEEVSGFDVQKLKRLCRLNGCKVTGTKKELIERVVDGMMWGAIPKCPKCSSGILRVKYTGSKFGIDGQGSFSCPGAFDDDEYVSCDFTSEEVTREKWKNEDD